MFVRPAAGTFITWLFSLCCQFVWVLAKSKWPAELTEVAPRVSFFPHSALIEERNFLTLNYIEHTTYKCSWDMSYSPSIWDVYSNTHVRAYVRAHTHIHTCTHTSSLKPSWLNFQLLILSVFSPCSNDIFLRLFHKSRHKPPANLSWAQRGPCHILGDDRQRRVLQ